MAFYVERAAMVMGGVEESWVMNMAASLSLWIKILMRSSLEGGGLMKGRSAIEGRAKQNVRNDIEWR
jgi:hypothetical protein